MSYVKFILYGSAAVLAGCVFLTLSSDYAGAGELAFVWSMIAFGG
jgi:hypothetical protein